MPVDRAFGNSGEIWTVVSSVFDLGFQVTRRAYSGGAVAGLNTTGAGPVSVVWAWTLDPVFQMTRAVLFHFPADGRPMPEDALRSVSVTRSGEWATPLAACGLPSGETAVLLRVEDERNNAKWTRPIYPIRVAQTGAVPGLTREFVLTFSDLFDPVAAPATTGYPRMIAAGADFLVVSGSGSRLLITAVPSNGGAVRKTAIDLGGAGTAIPGAVKLEVASIGFDGTWLSVAFTAFLNHPGIGASSVGALLRVTPAGSRHVGFGDNGLWVSPLTPVFRQFVCAGEVAGGLAGIQGPDAVVFGLTPQGELDDLFGVDGAFRRSLGGALTAAVVGSDAAGSYLFARRSDGRTVGCRVSRTGFLDSTFGNGGLAVLGSSTMPSTPSAMRVDNGRITLAATRQVEGLHCDRIPTITVVNATTGRPDQAFGAGGFSLHAKIVASAFFGAPAAIRPDGSCIYTERDEFGPAMALRLADAAGHYERRLAVTFPGTIDSLFALDDGSVLVGGSGTPGWVAKLTPGGTLNAGFGVAGVARVPGADGRVRVLGVRWDGRIAVEVETEVVAPWPTAAALLHPDGSLDLTYAAAVNGFLSVYGFTHAPRHDTDWYGSTWATLFLQSDGSILCAITSSRERVDSPHVLNGLRRITPGGEYDPAFGLGQPSAAALSPGTIVRFRDGANKLDGYSSVLPVGIVEMGGSLYLVSQGAMGGFLPSAGDRLPAFGVLIVSRWNADGTVDNGFARQEAGRDPNLDYWPRGVLPLSGTEALVFGEAGAVEPETHSIGGLTFNIEVKRRPEPALFRITYPAGFDEVFGARGVDRMPLQDFEALALAARVLPPVGRTGERRVRYVCADLRSQKKGISSDVREPVSNFGGIGQFTFGRIRPRPVP